MRRLEERGRLDDLRDFLGLHRLGQGERPSPAEMLRPTIGTFDTAAADLRCLVGV